VYGNAQVFGDVWVYGNAQVSGNARVSGNAQVSGNARVSGDVQMSGNAQVFGDAWETSPLYIQGSNHPATNTKRGSIAIGCEVHTFAEWLKNYKIIGKAAGYTPKQIKEYKAIIDLFIKIGR
jgi:carbonic anhydrase/acetyltransferase-like protein (isoleucine patch superfamily)